MMSLISDLFVSVVIFEHDVSIKIPIETGIIFDKKQLKALVIICIYNTKKKGESTKDSPFNT